MSRLVRDLALLEHWAPAVLQQWATADPNDLREIIRLRARAGALVAEELEKGQLEPFLALLRVDRACVPFCGTLLRLSSEEAREASGGSLDRYSWYGVHLHEVSQVLPSWVGILRDQGVKVSQTEFYLAVHRALDSPCAGAILIADDGGWSSEPTPEALRALLSQVRTEPI